MPTERQQAAAALLSLQACLMNRVSVFWWSRQTVPSARAKPPVKCSLCKILAARTAVLAEPGSGEGAEKMAAFRQPWSGATHSGRSTDSLC